MQCWANIVILRWMRELNALHLQKTHANRKSTRKSRKHLHQFDSRWCKCSQHKQIKKQAAEIDESVFLICRCFFLFAARFFFWLCCEHLQRVRCKIEEVVSLICRGFFCSALTSLWCHKLIGSVASWGVEHTYSRLVRCQSVPEYDAIGSECYQFHSSKRRSTILQAADNIFVHSKY